MSGVRWPDPSSQPNGSTPGSPWESKSWVYWAKPQIMGTLAALVGYFDCPVDDLAEEFHMLRSTRAPAKLWSPPRAASTVVGGQLGVPTSSLGCCSRGLGVWRWVSGVGGPGGVVEGRPRCGCFDRSEPARCGGFERPVCDR